MKPKVISFDLDGTLTDSSFANNIWLEEVPKLYANKNKISFDAAKKIVLNNYNKVGSEKLEWYNLQYWFNKFNIDKKPKEILASHKNKIKLFDDVHFILKKLSKLNKKIIIISNARREFVDLEIQQTKIRKFFNYIFSATSDFNLTKNNPTIFQEVCKTCKISPFEMIHIGDDYKFDYQIPKKIGIKAIYLNREKQKTENCNKEEIITLRKLRIL
jgi:putative hydrolase of the HAD superfamily